MSDKRDQASEKPTGSGTVLERVFVDDFAKVGTQEGNVVVDFLANRFKKPRVETKAALFIQDSRGVNQVQPIRNFLLQSFNPSFAERAQITEMYSGIDVVLLGEKYVNLNLSLLVYNLDNLNWRDQWMYLWENYLRATIATRNGWRTIFIADNIIMEGLLLQYQFPQTAGEADSVMISVQMVCDVGNFYPLKVSGTANVVPDNLGQSGKDIMTALKKYDGPTLIANGV